MRTVWDVYGAKRLPLYILQFYFYSHCINEWRQVMSVYIETLIAFEKCSFMFLVKTSSFSCMITYFHLQSISYILIVILEREREKK
jgi:hypothetical protein